MKASVDFRDIARVFWAQFGKSGWPSSYAEAKSSTSPLVAAIETIGQQTSVDSGYEEIARSAVSDAAAIALREFPDAHPNIELTDEGVLTLQWQGRNGGVILVFTGDATATYSIKEPGGCTPMGQWKSS